MTEPTPPEEAQVQQILEGQALSVLRIRRRKTQGDLAAWMGVQPSVISSWEKGRRKLEESDRAKLLELLGYTQEAFERIREVLQELDLLELPAIGAETTEEGFRKQRARLLMAEREAYGNLLAAREDRLSILRRIQTARENAPQLWRVLEKRDPAKWRMLVRGTQTYQDWALCELVCHESLRRAGDQPAEALQLAQLAVWIAECVPGLKDWQDQVKGFAWAHLGNSQRASGKLLLAAETSARADEFWEAGTRVHPVILNPGRMLSLKASLRFDQGLLAEALDCLEQARSAGGSSERVKIELQAGRVLEELGRFTEALTVLDGVAEEVTASGDIGLAFAWRFNRASCLCQAGRVEEAAPLLFEAQALGQRLHLKLHNKMRLRWLEGRLAAAAGRHEEAVVALQEVSSKFAGQLDATDTALATLELSEVLLRLGRVREVRQRAKELVPLFGRLGLTREGLATCHLFCQAATTESATVEMVQHILRLLNTRGGSPPPR